MLPVACYTPDFYRQFPAGAVCICESCQQQRTLTTLTWNNHQRQSALIGCPIAAQAILCQPDAFVLTKSEALSPKSASPLNHWQQQMNQFALTLLTDPRMTLAERLYTLGVFLSKASQLSEEEEETLTELIAELDRLTEQGILQQQLQLLPDIATFKREALRQLGHAGWQFNQKGLGMLAFTTTLTELGRAEDEQLTLRSQKLAVNWLQEGEAWAEGHPWIIQNMLLYRLYHDVFPGSQSGDYLTHYCQLVLDYAQLRLLCALWIEQGETLSGAIVADFAHAQARSASQRDVAVVVGNHAPLLVGLSLIGM